MVIKIKSGGEGLRRGEIHVTGSRPEESPYVWIGDEQGRFLAFIEPRQMNALVRQWQKANAPSKRKKTKGK